MLLSGWISDERQFLLAEPATAEAAGTVSLLLSSSLDSTSGDASL